MLDDKEKEQKNSGGVDPSWFKCVDSDSAVEEGSMGGGRGGEGSFLCQTVGGQGLDEDRRRLIV